MNKNEGVIEFYSFLNPATEKDLLDFFYRTKISFNLVKSFTEEEHGKIKH